MAWRTDRPATPDFWRLRDLGTDLAVPGVFLHSNPRIADSRLERVARPPSAIRSPYSAVLPYNLNWMLGARDSLVINWPFGPITLVDVGCRGEMSDEMWPLRRLVHNIGFDADPLECDRLNAGKRDLLKSQVFPFFVGGTNGEGEFHIYKRPAESSALKPDPRYARLFADSDFAIEKTIKVQTTTLDTFFQGRPDLPRPDILKLDTQGTELAILQGATECLRSASMVEVEVEFTPLYEGQALFPDVMKHMLESGFELLYINRVFAQRKGYSGIAKGQITFGDALFARREDRGGGFDEQRLARYVLLLINYGYLDLAHGILASHPFEKNAIALFDGHLKQGRGLWEKVRGGISAVIDKAALTLLHLRRHNGLGIDSDRSWPFR